MNDELTKRVEALEAILGIGNLKSSSVQNKDALFNGHFGLTNRTALPATGRKGELAVKNGALYIASAANTWSAVGTSLYGGDVPSNATGATLPSGWSVALSSHNYTITHNLGTTNYIVLAMPIANTTTFICDTINVSSNSFLIQWESTGATPGDTRFSFILIPLT